MPADPADLAAKVRRDLGLTCQLEQPRLVLPHNSRGGSRGYDVWYREVKLALVQDGQPTTVSRSSIFRWGRRMLSQKPTISQALTRTAYSSGIIWVHIIAPMFIIRECFLYRAKPTISSKIRTHWIYKLRLEKDEDWTMNRLEQEIMIAANQTSKFHSMFVHCGYRWNWIYRNEMKCIYRSNVMILEQ